MDKSETHVVLRDVEFTCKLSRKLFLTIWVKGPSIFYYSSKIGFDSIIKTISNLLVPYLQFRPQFEYPTLSNVQGSLLLIEEFPEIQKLFNTDLTSKIFLNLCQQFDIRVYPDRETNNLQIKLITLRQQPNVGLNYIASGCLKQNSASFCFCAKNYEIIEELIHNLILIAQLSTY